MHVAPGSLFSIIRLAVLVCILIAFFSATNKAEAALGITTEDSATTTVNVATSISNLQISGSNASTTPVKLRTTSGYLRMGETSGLTFSGRNEGQTLYFSGTVADINQALETLTYQRNSTGTDTLEVSLVNQGEVFFTDNNHLYSFVSGSYTWQQASTAAQGQEKYGASGYLATITSGDENTFIGDRLEGDGWIGASDSGVEGTWKWVTGPEAGTTFWQGTGSGSTVGGNYANWNPGEPNQSGEEDCIQTYVASGRWNDLNCESTLGYVVEFGAPGDLPTVVAENISIVTNNIPVINSFTPLNNATGVSTDVELEFTLSKPVSKQTGDIVIKKSSDDTVVTTIDVSGDMVTASASTTVVIDPAVDLPESTQLYVVIPSTAFQDADDMFFGGISASSTWSFTTGDFTSPTLSNIASTTATTTATIAWDTNELASTQVYYGPTRAYTASSSETNTAPRVASHSVELDSLLPCTLYHYKVSSTDASSNNASSSTDYSFVTTGCEGERNPSGATSSSITANTGGSTSIQTENKTFSVSAPAQATATSSSFVIQIKTLTGSDVFSSLGRPGEKPEEVGAAVFDVTAIINGDTILDSFDTPITIEYQYTEQEIDRLDEASLWLYHYTDGAWVALDDCSLDTNTKTISCTTPSFSIFSLFGKVPEKSGGGGRRYNYGCKDIDAINYDFFTIHRASLCEYPQEEEREEDEHILATQVEIETTKQKLNKAAAPTQVCTPHISSYIAYGTDNNQEDVKKLEQFLNEKQGENLAIDGVYSREDVEAVKRFQKKYKSEVLTVWGLSEPTGYVYKTTLIKINSFYCNSDIACPAFTEHNSLHRNNTSSEVAQTKVLLTELGFYNGVINTVFDTTLQQSIRKFQETFSDTILKPWGISQGTGYKYKTTNKFLNLIVGCTTAAVQLGTLTTVDY